jgi:hypothetical protein
MKLNIHSHVAPKLGMHLTLSLLHTYCVVVVKHCENFTYYLYLLCKVLERFSQVGSLSPCITSIILQGLVEQGLCLSNSSAERLQEKLGEELTSQISNLLGKLTSGELVPTTLTRPSAPPPVSTRCEITEKTSTMIITAFKLAPCYKMLLLQVIIMCLVADFQWPVQGEPPCACLRH